jgi:hypothetical protein
VSSKSVKTELTFNVLQTIDQLRGIARLFSPELKERFAEHSGQVLFSTLFANPTEYSRHTILQRLIVMF